ncbi:MAG: cobalamin-binding protein [Pseudomonadales bacterium]
MLIILMAVLWLVSFSSYGAVVNLQEGSRLRMQEGISVEDGIGNVVRLKQPARRVVALAPHIVENLYSAGAGKEIVAAVGYSDYPEEAKKLPHVGSYNVFSVEAILSFKPDLVVAWKEGSKAEHLDQLRSLGLAVYVSNPGQLEDLAKNVRDLGILTGHSETATDTADAYLTELLRLREHFSKKEPVSIFYQVWDEPLQTLNGEHLVSDVFKLCGGRNVFADEPSVAPKINLESLLKADPEAIIASGMGESKPEWLDNWRNWPSLRAATHNNLYFVPPDLIQRHSLRILQGARIVCDQLEKVRSSRF